MRARERNLEEFIRHSFTLLLEKEGRFHHNYTRQPSTTQSIMHVLEAPAPLSAEAHSFIILFRNSRGQKII